MRTRTISLLAGFFLLAAAAASFAGEVPLSPATAECLDCHASLHPGIVADWWRSRHARTTPGAALAGEKGTRRVTGKALPEELKERAVGCAECHTQRSAKHADTFEHNGHAVHVAVSPEDCGVCHADEAGEYGDNLMSFAHDNLAKNHTYQQLVRTVIGKTTLVRDEILMSEADEKTESEACLYCHGTRLRLAGRVTRATDAGELEFPVINGWPNQGVGRINLDGSRGACTPCHTRHAFDIAMARKPDACRECHLGPDVPAYKVYHASKHGNLYTARRETWDFAAVPWTPGKDFTAPTCATCHISALAGPQGETIAKRTHRINDRLAWRIFGLIYAHPHPAGPDTTRIKNSAGLALPTDLNGTPAREFLIDGAEQARRTAAMQAVCNACHATSWIAAHFARFEQSIEETNAKIRIATGLMEKGWAGGYARGMAQGKNPFDEPLEKEWTEAWLFYANSIRFASAMAGGGVYGVFADGRYALSRKIGILADALKRGAARAEGQ